MRLLSQPIMSLLASKRLEKLISLMVSQGFHLFLLSFLLSILIVVGKSVNMYPDGHVFSRYSFIHSFTHSFIRFIVRFLCLHAYFAEKNIHVLHLIQCL